jgi:hypothetical protein
VRGSSVRRDQRIHGRSGVTCWTNTPNPLLEPVANWDVTSRVWKIYVLSSNGEEIRCSGAALLGMSIYRGFLIEHPTPSQNPTKVITTHRTNLIAMSAISHVLSAFEASPKSFSHPTLPGNGHATSLFPSRPTSFLPPASLPPSASRLGPASLFNRGQQRLSLLPNGCSAQHSTVTPTTTGGNTAKRSQSSPLRYEPDGWMMDPAVDSVATTRPPESKNGDTVKYVRGEVQSMLT